MKKLKSLFRGLIEWSTTYKRCWGKDVRTVFPYRLTWIKVQNYRYSVLLEKILVVFVVMMFVTGIGYALFRAGQASVNAQVHIVRAEQMVEVDKSEEIFKTKIDALKDDVINQLISCEAPGYKDTDVVVTYDPLVSNPSATPKRNIPSYGPLQFKQDTVIHYYKMQHGKTLTPKEAVLLALDREQATELAKFVLFSTKNKAGGDWVNCEAKLGLDKQIDLIKKLEINSSK